MTIVVTIGELLETVWKGRIVSEGSVYNCVSELRLAPVADTGRPYEVGPLYSPDDDAWEKTRHCNILAQRLLYLQPCHSNRSAPDNLIRSFACLGWIT